MFVRYLYHSTKQTKQTKLEAFHHIHLTQHCVNNL
jgi:hypothetical protein